MKILNSTILQLFVICFLSVGGLFAQDANNNPSKSADLPSIEVSKFDQEPKVGFPVDYFDKFAAIMIEELKKSGKFNQVVLADEKNKNIQPPVRFHLSGTVTNHTTDKLNRYLLLGYRTEEIILVRITLFDNLSGKVILEKKVDGLTVFNFRRGNVATDAAMKGAAIQAVRNIKKVISK